MPVHLHRDLENLKKEILLLGAMVEDAANKSWLALVDRRAELAQEVIDGDRQVDDQEVQLEEECLKVLALHQPVAQDLRFVVTVMKVNNDLERVGDLAGNLAERAVFLAGQPAIAQPEALQRMADVVRTMLRDSLSAVVNQDTDLARKVLREDQEVDDTHARLYGIMGGRMRESPDEIERLMNLMSVSRYLERIADLATNIAEDVVFLVDGDVIRHQHG